MKAEFVSTRSPDAEAISFPDALRRGLAPDGGLYVPRVVPELPVQWRSASSFAELGAIVAQAWLHSAYEPEVVDSVIEDALDFPVPLVPLGGAWTGIHVLELFHGPTLSFKDFGARVMARLLRAGMHESDSITVLVATSGDTGSAVADGFSGIPGVRVLLLYPEGQVSPIQERQLIMQRPGVQALRVAGTFDDCQRLVKGAFDDPSLAKYGLSSANSINIGRLLPQMMYYLWTARMLGEPTRFVVPSGNLGNLTGGMFAMLGGMRVDGFLAAHNANDFFPRFLAGADPSFAASIQTCSNAMDVGAPSNFERLMHLLGADRLRATVRGISLSDAETLDSMRRIERETGYIADPHTAVGLEGARRTWMSADQPVVVLSTAHPAKFPEIMQRALGHSVEPPERLQHMIEANTRVEGMAATPSAFHAAIERHAGNN